MRGNSNVNLALIGCGLHAKRIYAKYLRDRILPPKIIVDIISNKQDILEVIAKNGWQDTKTYFVTSNDSYEAFTDSERSQIQNEFMKLAITKAIIATPPEVHVPYAILCLEI